MSVEIGLRDIFTTPTIAGLSQRVKQKELTEFITIQPVPEQEYYDLSHAQRRLWVLHQLENQSSAYNMPAAFTIRGDLNIEALNNAFRGLITRHESLRTCFTAVEGVPKQVVRNKIDFSIHQEPAVFHQTDSLVKQHTRQVFDLTRAPLFNVKLLHLGDREYMLLFNMHHIISDGWSNNILVNQLMTLYNAYSNPGGPGFEDRESLPPPLRVRYKDYSLWQNTHLTSLLAVKQK